MREVEDLLGSNIKAGIVSWYQPRGTVKEMDASGLRLRFDGDILVEIGYTKDYDENIPMSPFSNPLLSAPTGFNELRATYDRIADGPLAYQDLRSGIRRALLRRFPYAVYFAVDGDVAVVLTVLHVGRDPAEWQRLRGHAALASA